jgi:hypothetical protein
MINIILFFSINVLNNHAFSYDISVPVHIILRSGGSITTMCAGYLWGKRFSRIQVTAVIFLTLGVILAAWSDAQAKVCCPLSSSEQQSPHTGCRTQADRTMTKESRHSALDLPFYSWHKFYPP